MLVAAEEAAAVSDELDDSDRRTRALINAGDALYRRGRYRQAQDRYAQAARLVGPEPTDQATLEINIT